MTKSTQPKRQSSASLVSRVGPASVIGLAYMIGYLLAPSAPSEAFFEAAAQVVPVLLLALAVESRWLRLSNLSGIQLLDAGWLISAYQRANTAMVMAVPVLGLCYAEWRCLQRIGSEGNPSTLGVDFALRTDAGFVSGGILCGLVGVALVALLGPGPDENRSAASTSESVSASQPGTVVGGAGPGSGES